MGGRGMVSGFESLKDLLEVLIIPIVVFAVGALLPRWFEAEKTRRFLALIERELDEMEPWPKEPVAGGTWCAHLNKRFVHEEIFADVTANRDFLLSLPAEVTYHVAQMWIHFGKGKAGTTSQSLQFHGDRWCEHLKALCVYLDRRGGNRLSMIHDPWRRLMVAYQEQSTLHKQVPGSK